MTRNFGLHEPPEPADETSGAPLWAVFAILLFGLALLYWLGN